MLTIAWVLASCSPAGQQGEGTPPIAGSPHTGEPDSATPDSGVDPVTFSFDPLMALSRASLDLRGERPSLQELAQVRDDPDAYFVLVDEFLQDERFGAQVRELFNQIYQTRQDGYSVYAYEFGLDDEIAFAANVGDEPLQLLSYIAVNDLPYTTIVTADYTMANEVLGASFPVDRPEDAEGWVPAPYIDGRQNAGVLSMNGMWWRYTSTLSNANRGRANAVTRILVCNDYLGRPVEFDRNVNLLDDDALNQALLTNDGCVSCHHAIEPLAAHFWGFFHNFEFSMTELNYYHPERESFWQDYLGVAPGFQGTPTSGLEELGRAIAADSRLPECLTEQTFGLLLDREPGIDDFDTLSDHREHFIEEGLLVRTLFREVVTSEEYVTRTDATGDLRPKMLTPALLASSVEGLTGFRFVVDGYDVLASTTNGLLTLAGGIDGVFALEPTREPAATIVLVQERVAQAAAHYVVAEDAAATEGARLFTEIDFTETPDTALEPMVAQLQLLRFQVLGQQVDADGAEVAADLLVWQQLVDAGATEQEAWAGVLSLLLREPEFIFY